MDLLNRDNQGLGGGNSNLVDRLCRALGWSIDDRNDDMFTLVFKGDHVTPKRAVLVYHSGGPVMSFGCPCAAQFTTSTLPISLPLLLMCRSKSLMGSWGAHIGDDDSVRFTCDLTTLAEGMNAETFKYICSQMLEEVAEVENILSGKGLM